MGNTPSVIDNTPSITVTKQSNGYGEVVTSVQVVGTLPSCPNDQELFRGLCYKCPSGLSVTAPGICSLNNQNLSVKQKFESIGVTNFTFMHYILAGILVIILLIIYYYRYHLVQSSA